MDFAEDILLMSDAWNQAQELLLKVERESKGVGIMLNSKRTKSMFFNVDFEQLKTKFEKESFKL